MEKPMKTTVESMLAEIGAVRRAEGRRILINVYIARDEEPWDFLDTLRAINSAGGTILYKRWSKYRGGGALVSLKVD